MKLSTRTILAGIAIILLIAGGFFWRWQKHRYNGPVMPPPPMSAVIIPPDRLSINDTIVRSGDVVTSKDLSDRYYVASTMTRYIFPTNDVYATWYPQTMPVKTIERKSLESIRLIGNVTMRPGMRILTFDTDPSFYVVSHGGILHGTSESLLRQWYGSSWKDRVTVVPEYYRADYHIGDPIQHRIEYSPTEQYNSSPTISQDKNLVPALK